MPEGPSAASVMVKGQKARSKRVFLTQARTEGEGGKLKGMEVRRKFQKQIKVLLPPIRKVPLGLTYSSFLSL